MSRDYKHAEIFSSAAKPLPGWIWLFALVAIGSFAGLIYYLDQYEQEKSLTQQPAERVEAVPAKKEAPDSSALAKSGEADDGDKSRFDFYKLLPKLRVDVPEGEVVKDRAEPDPPPANDITEKVENTPIEKPAKIPEKSAPLFRYILQAGSFKDHREADRLKASLALMGIVANIEPVVLNRSDTWHRVRIGPIDSEREMNKIRNRLRGQSIEPIMLKVKV